MADLSPEQYLALENAEPQPPAEARNTGVARRTLLKFLMSGAAVSAVYGGLHWDTETGEQLYGGGPPQIGMIADAEAEQKFPHHYNIVGGGFGVYNIEGLATHVHEGLGHFGQTAYIKNSNSGLQIEKQKRVTLDFLEERGGEVVNLYGHSMDGMEMTEIGSFLMRNGVEVQSIFLDCTPEKKYDVRPDKRVAAEVLAAVDRYGELLDVYGGPVMRFAAEYTSRVLDGRVDYDQIVVEALSKLTPKNTSTRLLLGEARYICAFNGPDWGPDYSNKTAIAKLRPENWLADQTINNRTALVNWRYGTFPHLLVHDVAIKGGGHANPGASGARYTDAIVRFGTELGLYQAKWGAIGSHIFLK